MKKEDIPQDEGSLKDSDFKELCYAINDKGDYTTALSSGWKPKTIALNNTIADIEERVAIAKAQVIEGSASPLLYYMELHKMDIGILSSYAGVWQWRVKRHLKARGFKKLPQKTLKKYADVFEISVNKLKDILSHED